MVSLRAEGVIAPLAWSPPTLRAVFVEDAVSVSGDVIALAAMALTRSPGGPYPGAWPRCSSGQVLIRISLRLIKHSHDFPGRRQSRQVKRQVIDGFTKSHTNRVNTARRLIIEATYQL